jgi:ubiquinone/menaquinone biosynthesis C-methylase UbiE
MDGMQKYLGMQKEFYEREAAKWSLQNRDPVVGSYDAHNMHSDYETKLFKDFDTTDKIALEYGCGPGRNLIRFQKRFKQIDGVDISHINLLKAKENIENYVKGDPSLHVTSDLFQCDGKSIPCDNEKYDVVFSVICLQHIACWDIRFSIFKEVYRVLKTGGHFCFQMNWQSQRSDVADYYANSWNATETNGGFDVRVDHEDQLIGDLCTKIGFRNFKHEVTGAGPGDSGSWVWAQVEK